MRMVVVLPAPLGPMKPYTSPFSSLSVSRSRAYNSPYIFVRSRVSIMSAILVCLLWHGLPTVPLCRPQVSKTKWRPSVPPVAQSGDRATTGDESAFARHRQDHADVGVLHQMGAQVGPRLVAAWDGPQPQMRRQPLVVGGGQR